MAPYDILETLPKLAAYGRRMDFELSGDILLAHPLEIVQHDDLALLNRQAKNRFLHCQTLFFGCHQFARSFRLLIN